ncbi:putative monocarboxylate permease [Aspergillus clavatus NRRL 1]|uniref:Monocarboxylate permease, putative n=1 Tax=Aspergillus clavatus (strain ATCC 1007 / CBS 513.65 / DSM 816 / NCTC 3887 / NRRL 1 / QM 1276 / 107) TaxID=344612 RepID=A1CDV8_ASPCL|nr:monocarboxylate permease, putative [Aspergillus clavatus NRRL 1]EAW12035.1 monocarboxylate permease, putative [Aspergillus clavatus NRRL 1]
MQSESKQSQEQCTPVQPQATPSKPPDKGLRAWLHVFYCHMVFFNTWGLANSYGIFQVYYTQTLDHPPSDIGWIGGIQMFLLLFGGVFSGRASDAGYFRQCFVAGVILQVLGLCMASLSTWYYEVLLSQAVCVGIGSGLVFTPGLSVMGSYFHKNRSIAVGLAAAGAATGGMVYPATANALLFHSDVGYPWAMRILALVLLAAHVPALVGYRPYLPPRSTGPVIEWHAFRERPFVFFTASMFLNFWGLYMAFYYLGTFAREQIHITASVDLLIVLNGVGVIGRSCPCILGERFTGIVNITIFCSILCAACVYCWTAVNDSAGLYAWAVVYGIVAGAAQALFPAMATRQTSDISRVGTRTGMVLTIVSFACLTAPAIQGALIQADQQRYLGAQAFSASSIVLGVVFLWLHRWSRVGLSLKVKV